MIPKARHLPEALAESEAGSALLHRYRASQRAAAIIEPECRSILPEFHPTRSGICDLRGTTLRVNARYPAQVAKLRQAAPRLLRLLQQQGFDVIEIKIGVQPRSLSSSERPELRRGADRTPQNLRLDREMQSALGFAQKLALTLPDSPLRLAVQRLRSALSVGLARMRDSGQVGDQQDGEKHQP